MEDRYAKSSTVVTTQIPTKNWHEKLRDRLMLKRKIRVMILQLSGADASGSAGAVTASASLNWHWSWAWCAADQYETAARARDDLLATRDGIHIQREFHASLLAVAACAFSLEALHNELAPIVVDALTLSSWKRSKPSRAARAHQTLPRAGRLAATARADIGWLFGFRNGAVHPISRSLPPPMHPSGHSHVAQPEAAYTVENAKRALRLVRDSFAGCVDHPSRLARAWMVREGGGLIQAVAQIDRCTPTP